MKNNEFEGKIDAKGELELYRSFWARLKEAVSAPEVSRRLVKAVGKKKRLDWYSIRTYDLGVARIDELVTDFPRDGDCILVLSISTDATASIKFDSPNSDSFEFPEYRKLRHNFSNLYLTNTATSGMTLYLLLGRGDWDVERHYPQEVMMAINADTTDSIHASASREANKLLALGADAMFPDGAVRNIQSEIYANRPATPVVGDMFIATDTGQILICFTAGTWTDITAASSISIADAGSLITATNVEDALQEIFADYQAGGVSRTLGGDLDANNHSINNLLGVGTGAVSAPVVRTATLVVAANNSSAKFKAQADVICDGTNDQVEIQAAIDAVVPAGGTIVLSDGDFYITQVNFDLSQVTDVITGGLIFTGQGKFATRLRQTVTDRDAVTLVGKAGVGAYEATFRHFSIINSSSTNYTGFHISSPMAWAKMKSMVVRGLFKQGYEVDGLIDNCFFDCCVFSNDAFVTDMKAFLCRGYSCTFLNCHASGDIGFLMGGDCNVLINCGTESARRPVTLYNPGVAVTNNNQIFGGLFNGDNHADSVGIDLAGARYVSIFGPTITECVTPITMWDPVYPGILLLRNPMTVNKGVATLANGTTSIAVNHGLCVTATPGDIMVTPVESLGVASKFWIQTDYTSTQFIIHVDVNPTQDVDFAWQAVVL